MRKKTIIDVLFHIQKIAKLHARAEKTLNNIVRIVEKNTTTKKAWDTLCKSLQQCCKNSRKNENH